MWEKVMDNDSGGLREVFLTFSSSHVAAKTVFVQYIKMWKGETKCQARMGSLGYWGKSVLFKTRNLVGEVGDNKIING